MGELHGGLYDQVVTTALEARLGTIPTELVLRIPIDPTDAHEGLTRHVGDIVRRALAGLGEHRDGLAMQIHLTNQLIELLVKEAPDHVAPADQLTIPGDVLTAIAMATGHPGPPTFPLRPETPLSDSALLVNGRGQPSIGTEIQRELASADRVDLLCAFVKWHGVRVINDQLAELTRRGVPLRVITTTYMGATERRAVDRMVELGAQVKISYETNMTRLHAKSWLFERATGFSTAYVGSSNLSRAAMLDGLEWNVRLTAVQQPHLLDTFRATFDQYWADPAFEPYDPGREADRNRLDEALARAGSQQSLPLQLSTISVEPRGYQRAILETLEAERQVHNRWRNLVVMATGTGKTVVAGLDYRRLREARKVDSILFIAHREEILDQSLATFRHILRDGAFGERFVGGHRPRDWRHVFASIQSLARLDLATELDPKRFDMVIVDEFHHASEATKTYASLLHHLEPRALLGLTATPERADGADIRLWFDGRIAVELRLWEALESNLLAPFQYFGIHDETDLSSIRWKRGSGYDSRELTNVYTGHDARVAIVLQAVQDKIADVGRMRAIGFCVSIAHAEFMAARFNAAGIPSLAVSSRSSDAERVHALRSLRDRQVNVLFAVDLFNEGIDLPELDTVMFLRPTESATVFLQQLGRGLRLAEGKACLTVLDFIGQQHAEFRFDVRYRALTGTSRRDLVRAIAEGFPSLPSGCRIQLDQVASDLVLENVRSRLRIDWIGLKTELTKLGDVPLSEFLRSCGLQLDDLYRRNHGGWGELRRMAGLEVRARGPQAGLLGRAIGRMTHMDDPERLNFLLDLLRGAAAPSVAGRPARELRLLAMLHFALWGSDEPIGRMEDGLRRLWEHPSQRDELLEVVRVLTESVGRVTQPLEPQGPVPLHVHARYSRDEALAAFGVDKPGAVRQGVKWVEDEAADLLFVTLRKTEKHYSPSTMYQDRAISPSLFQWESQSTTSSASPTGQRYATHREHQSTVHLFIRDTKESDGDTGAPPYMYGGPANYVNHSGDRPMRVLWKLEYELPDDTFHAARVATG